MNYRPIILVLEMLLRLRPMYLVSSCDQKMNCAIEMELALLFYWLSLFHDVTPQVGLCYGLMVRP